MRKHSLTVDIACGGMGFGLATALPNDGGYRRVSLVLRSGSVRWVNG
ncbi:MAG: hypothetical protein HWQ38_00065 [Nostoc sp. NMS7]|nr:hypothetical protein [Nostoc sp. NMS7]MBN3944960.1 hypothetical protein [Nostoc sp. NMS7]